MHMYQLKYLIEISNSPSMNIASEKLNISYQALSHSVKALEQELNLTLLKRTNKGSTLTEDGEKVVALSKQFIKGIAQIQAQRSGGDKIGGAVRLITSDICMEYFVFDLMDYCKKYYPRMEFQCKSSYNDLEEVFLLLREDVSCFFLSIWGLEIYNTMQADDIRHYVVAPSAVRCVCSQMHELAGYRSVSFKQMKKYTLLMRHPFAAKQIMPSSFRAVEVESNPLLFEKKILSGEYISFTYAVPFAPYWIPPVNNAATVDVHTQSDAHLALFCHKDFCPPAQTRIFLDALYHKFGVNAPETII